MTIDEQMTEAHEQIDAQPEVKTDQTFVQTEVDVGEETPETQVQ